MNLAELGSLLKRERERRGLSVRDVMDATKISRRNLNALEAGEVRFLPHPVYLKGYVRNYAKLIGLDSEPLVAIVDEQSDGDSGYVAQASPAVLAPELPAEPAEVPAAPAEPPSLDVGELPLAAPQPAPQDVPPDAPRNVPRDAPRAAAAPQPLGPQAPKARPNLRTRLALLVLVAALGGALYYYQLSAQEAPPPAPAPAAAPVVDNASEAANATLALPAENATAEPAAPAPEAAPAPAAPAARTAPSASVDPAAPAVAPAPSGSVPAASIEVSRKASPAGQSAPAAPAAPENFGSGQELIITAKPGELCWMELSDGQKSKSFILRNGESRKVEFGSKLRVRLGNSGGVTFRLNGEMHPFAGERGQKQVVEFGPR